MVDKKSYVEFEKEYRKIFRVKIDQSDDHIDIEKQFTIVLRDFMQDVIGDQFEVRLNDIVLDLNAPSHYVIAPRLAETDAFRQAMADSDLPSILDRFAESAYHKYFKLQKLARVEEQTRNQKGALFKKVRGRGMASE